MIWIHRDCGYAIEAILWASDGERDYYDPFCPIHGSLTLQELEFIQAEGAD